MAEIFKYNPFTRKLDIAGDDSFGTGTGYSAAVNNYSALPDPTTSGGKFYYVINSQGTSWLPGNMGGTYYPPGTYYSDGVNWFTGVSPWQASQADVNAGIIPDQFVSPLTLNNWSGANGGQTAIFTWKYSTNIATADPGNGFFRGNNAVGSLITQLYINDITSDNQMDISALFGAIQGNWLIHIQQKNDASKFIQFTTSTPYTDNTGWWTVPVTYVQSGSGGSITNLTNCLFTFVNKNAGNPSAYTSSTKFIQADITGTNTAGFLFGIPSNYPANPIYGLYYGGGAMSIKQASADIMLFNGGVTAYNNFVLQNGTFTQINSFTQSIGSTAYNGYTMATTINQTGTANGVVRGFYYNPTVTAILGTHYCFESTSGNMLVGGTGGYMLNDAGTPRMALNSPSAGVLRVGGTAFTTLDFGPANITSSIATWDASGGLIIKSGTGANFIVKLTHSTNKNNTGTPYYDFLNQTTFNPSAGTGSYTSIFINPTINQTGTAKGDVFGIIISPVLTSILGRYASIQLETVSGVDTNVMDWGVSGDSSRGLTHKFYQDGSGFMSWKVQSRSTSAFTPTYNTILSINTSSLTGVAQAFVWGNSTTGLINTAGDVYNFNLVQGVNVGSGNANFNFLSIRPTINQSGATGIIRGVFYNPPSVTVSGTHLAWESTSGSIIFGGSSATVTAGNGGIYITQEGTIQLSGSFVNARNGTHLEMGNFLGEAIIQAYSRPAATYYNLRLRCLNFYVLTGAAQLALTIDSNGIATFEKRVQLQSSSLGLSLLKLTSTTGGTTNPIIDILQDRVLTTDATVTTLHSFPTTTDANHYIEVKVSARRTGGTSGTAGDSGLMIGTVRVKNVGGVLTVMNSFVDNSSADQPWSISWTTSGTNILLQVTGSANNNITWLMTEGKIFAGGG